MKRLLPVLPVLVLILSGFQTTSGPTEFYSSFDTAPSYVVPHRNNTTYKAASFENGVLKLTLEPGMYGAAGSYGDQVGGKERAELAQDVPFGHKVRMSFRFRVGKGFQATARTLIAQIKLGPSSPFSPSISVYADRGGIAKCNKYTKSGEIPYYVHFGDIARFDDSMDPLDDGEWHQIVMNFVPSDTNGYCSVDIDGINKIKRKGYDSIPTPQAGRSLDIFRARIGIYRDAQPFPQTVYFDDWKIETTPIIKG